MRVLHVYPQLNCGGTEMVFYNLIKFGHRDRFSYEILAQEQGSNEAMFRDIDVPIHYVAMTDEADYEARLKEFFAREQYDVVHTHMHEAMPLVLKAAKEAGVKCRVAHSHNARVDIPRFIWPLLYFKHHRYEQYATELFGCSSLALKWLFPSQWSRGHVISNGIDLDKFRFDADIREKTRSENGISPATKVFVNVGRATDQKNQRFILDRANERRGRDELYVIIGEGPLLDTLKEQKETLGLDNVRLLGKRTDVERWLCAADVFLFPSIYEGLGIVAVEAEASGLRVIATDTIPPEANMGLGSFLSAPLSDTARWNALMDLPAYTPDQRASLSQRAFDSDYNIKTITTKVESIYSK
ncbi:MAG: glycosyltransferase [Pseudoflavonifractor sp.]|nr:glycosyltransferase [Alloprevotella sp.]MCM1116078.1 glycosyltransferase [Pseudoflavonifractor sp.]